MGLNISFDSKSETKAAIAKTMGEMVIQETNE